MYVYVMYDKNDVALYVGKTKDIKRRVYQHFNTDVESWKSDVSKIKYLNCITEVDMNIYEIYLINKLSPKYNKSLVFSDDTNLILPYTLVEYNTNLDSTSLLSNEEKIRFRELITIIDDSRYNKNFYNKNDYTSYGDYILSKNWVEKIENKDNILRLFYNLTYIYKNKYMYGEEFKGGKMLWDFYEYPNFIVNVKTFKRISNFSLIKNNIDDSVRFLAYIKNDFYLDNNRRIDEELSLSNLIHLLKNSCLKNNKELLLYLPSERMRNLLNKYLNNE